MAQVEGGKSWRGRRGAKLRERVWGGPAPQGAGPKEAIGTQRAAEESQGLLASPPGRERQGGHPGWV